LVEQLVREHWSVTALVRETSDRRALEKLGVKFAVWDLSRPAPPPTALLNTDVVFHAAAAVRDWAPWPYFVEHTVRATARLCQAMIADGGRRLVHFSTVGVYGKPPRGLAVDEDRPVAPLHRLTDYARSKALAESVVWDHHQQHQLEVTVLRPTMIYGNGDHTFLGRVIPLLRAGKVVLVGDPETRLPMLHAADLAAAAIQVATHTATAGQTYNVSNAEPVTQSQFFNTIAELTGVPPVQRRVPYALAYSAGAVAETLCRLLHTRAAPRITRYRVYLFGYERRYSAQKLTATLGWQPRVAFADGVREAVRYHLEQEAGR
jgi:nucleoside-diphosphate-sugar epimerase